MEWVAIAILMAALFWIHASEMGASRAAWEWVKACALFAACMTAFIAWMSLWLHYGLGQPWLVKL